jgi:threonine dehydratase
MINVTMSDIVIAYTRIRPYISKTPLLYLPDHSKFVGRLTTLCC